MGHPEIIAGPAAREYAAADGTSSGLERHFDKEDSAQIQKDTTEQTGKNGQKEVHNGLESTDDEKLCRVSINNIYRRR